jgi:hypothetical protein
MDMLIDTRSPSYSLEDLLSKIGLDNRRPQLLVRCQSYNMHVETLQDFNLTLVDKEVSVPLTSCMNARPITEMIEDISAERGILSKIGEGWDKSKCNKWFSKKDEVEDISHG